MEKQLVKQNYWLKPAIRMRSTSAMRIVLLLLLALFGFVQAPAAVFHAAENRTREFFSIGYDEAASAKCGYDEGVAALRSALFLRAAAETIPRGFASVEQFSQASAELQMALTKAGISDASIGVRGSSVTGFSYRTGAPFGSASDIDFFVESGQLTSGLKTSSNIPGFVYPKVLNANFDPIADWSSIWSETLGRKVSVGGFQPGTVPAGATIRP